MSRFSILQKDHISGYSILLKLSSLLSDIKTRANGLIELHELVNRIKQEETKDASCISYTSVNLMINNCSENMVGYNH